MALSGRARPVAIEIAGATYPIPRLSDLPDAAQGRLRDLLGMGTRAPFPHDAASAGLLAAVLGGAIGEAVALCLPTLPPEILADLTEQQRLGLLGIILAAQD